jgi:hypothetical protein
MNKLIISWAIIVGSCIVSKFYIYSEAAKIGNKFIEEPVIQNCKP